MTKEEQIEDFRKRWKTATPSNRRVIEMRVELLKMKTPKRFEIENEVDEKLKLFS